MMAVTICSDFGAQENKVCHCFHCFTIYLSVKLEMGNRVEKKSRLAVTNLDNILKSRDVTLPTKVCIVKAIVFPVVMYGCESWTVKKAES